MISTFSKDSNAYYLNLPHESETKTQIVSEL